MDISFKEQDYSFIPLTQAKRLTAEGLKLNRLGLFRRKSMVIDRIFSTTSFSLILSGKGNLQSGNGMQILQSPCAMFNRTGEHYRYEPDGIWEEYFFVFDDDPVTIENQIGRLPETWTIGDVPLIRHYCEMIWRLADTPGIPGTADQLDRLAEALLIATRWSEKADTGTPSSRIYQAERWLRSRFTEMDLNIPELAARFSFSEPSFRRWWQNLIGSTPYAYLQELRMQEASRLLYESDLSISEIATNVGFTDASYFTRAFRKQTGMTPREMRAGTNMNI